MRELVENSVVKESLTVQIEGKRDLFSLSSDYKRRADIPVRQAGWKTRPPLKEILEGIGV
jgi:hypothetical protein